MKNLLTKVLALILLVAAFTSCSKSDDTPRIVEFRVTNISGEDNLTPNRLIIVYPDGNAVIDNITLPYSKKYSFDKLKLHDGFGAKFTSYTGGSVRLQILVDGDVVATQTGAGTSAIVAETVYVVPK